LFKPEKRCSHLQELKRQQEAFVDMTSHEIRNPLSAIIQSADSISASLAACLTLGASPNGRILSVSKEVLEDSMDAADTITLCAHHQKLVVNDILTLSKMDSDMLTVSPIDVEPLRIIQQVVKMFETESAKHGIIVTVAVESSFHELELHNVRLDPSRLTQVLVNILGNAIKFTKLLAEKWITIKVGGSIENPDDIESGIEYIRPDEMTIPSRFTDGSSPGSRMCFMRIAVHDTGPGLKPIEIEKLFKRFGQGNVLLRVYRSVLRLLMNTSISSNRS
jgi:signal transduction histidine kinase